MLLPFKSVSFALLALALAATGCAAQTDPGPETKVEVNTTPSAFCFESLMSGFCSGGNGGGPHPAPGTGGGGGGGPSFCTTVGMHCIRNECSALKGTEYTVCVNRCKAETTACLQNP